MTSKVFKIRASRLYKFSKAFHVVAGAVIGQRSEELEAHFISPAPVILLSPASGKHECFAWLPEFSILIKIKS